MKAVFTWWWLRPDYSTARVDVVVDGALGLGDRQHRPVERAGGLRDGRPGRRGDEHQVSDAGHRMRPRTRR
jgi:hypothetical protein